MAMLNNQMVTQINQILKYLKSPDFWKKTDFKTDLNHHFFYVSMKNTMKPPLKTSICGWGQPVICAWGLQIFKTPNPTETAIFLSFLS